MLAGIVVAMTSLAGIVVAMTSLFLALHALMLFSFHLIVITVYIFPQRI